MAIAVVTNILARLEGSVDSQTLEKIEEALTTELDRYELTLIKANSEKKDWESVLNDFVAYLKMSGRSAKTINGYSYIIKKVLETINKDIPDITEEDMTAYFRRMTIKGKSRIYMNNQRAYLNSFFKFCISYHYILTNPMDKVQKAKISKVVREAFTDEEILALQRACDNKRDIALLEFLRTSGVRVSELCSLDIDDIDLDERTGKVTGKGDKERYIMFSPTARMCLKEYLDTRTDFNPALFVSLREPHKRLDPVGVRAMLKKLEKAAGVEDVHPHKFRRTLASNLLKHGMPIEEVKEILGHDKIETTMIYASIDFGKIKASYNLHMVA